MQDIVDYKKLIIEVERHVTLLFELYWDENLIYHNLQHTQMVVDKVEEIASSCNKTEEEMFILATAAWFHDVGQLFVPPTCHEIHSVKVMVAFFSEKGVDAKLIQNIKKCILATNLNTTPLNMLEMILCDADTFNFGTDYFKVTDGMVREELTKRNALPMGDWDKITLDLLRIHQFYTPYCIQKLSKGKSANISLIESRIQAKL
ncbi:HD domain-containing protein [Pedobacter agri]|uniref:HD domain-containing protein n=1 Tax=Pedobacter agri TaxID=454586 RepID=UPI00292F93CF|nr:HD domain-containing protein [Pedobacter agri]